MRYENPIIKGFHPDPSICKAGDSYFLVTSSFEYLPGVPLFHSKDLVNWNQIGHCLTRQSQIDLRNCHCSGGIYAPTIRYHDKTFYMITTCMTESSFKKGNFIVSASDPRGDWSEPVWVKRIGIDPSLYWEDGRTFMQLAITDESGPAIEQFEINIETGDIIGESQIISRGTGGRDLEAPHMYKINGYYYLMVAEGGTRDGHMVKIMRSDTLWGPFESCPHNPILSNRDYASEQLQSVGHGDLIEDNDGNWWIVALATRPVELRHVLGRETILMPIIWSKDGWPIVKDNRALIEVDSDLYTPNIEKEQKTKLILDDFNEDSLAPCYNTMREFITDNYSLSDRKGYLSLRGKEWSLNDLEASTFIGRRQEEYHFNIETKLSFAPTAPNEEAGLVVYMDNKHHMDLVVTIRKGEKVVLLRKNVADIQVETEGLIVSQETSDIYLSIIGDTKKYYFSCWTSKEELHSVGSTMVKHLASECTNSAFTGVYIGMYASGNGKNTQTAAHFDYFKMENI
ncbi:glycoside hydrolase family 43 protein [Paraliobacillus sediminis]|uniref:glycoside hydrolase family 43 protein n=1 Tax=Paraliobacillus sediminis TaxID=1885916 RepID=UPI000E3E5D13|nr:glycoside hydrolase family 43 protein [Paraliobacillus sediminis]